MTTKANAHSVTRILVGRHHIGIAGLRDALELVDESGLREREEVIALMLEVLRPLNHIPEHQIEVYGTAFWREYLRHRGEDFGAWYSELPVTVRGQAGAERDRFIEEVRSVLASSELRPLVTLADVREDLGPAELEIEGEVVALSSFSRPRLEAAIRRRLSDW